MHDRNNQEILQLIGKIIYLKVDTEILFKRILKRGLPAHLDSRFPKQSFYELAEKRKAIFEKEAHVIVETDTLNEEEIIEVIIYGI